MMRMSAKFDSVFTKVALRLVLIKLITSKMLMQVGHGILVISNKSAEIIIAMVISSNSSMMPELQLVR